MDGTMTVIGGELRIVTVLLIIVPMMKLPRYCQDQ